MSPPLPQALKLIASTIALLPGIAVMLMGIMVPPDLHQFLGGLVTSIGAVIITVIFLMQKRINDLSNSCVIGIGVMCLIIALGSFFIYFIFYERLYREWILPPPDGRTLQLILPLYPIGQLKAWLGSLHSWDAAIAAHPGVEALINKQNTFSEAILLGLFLVSFSLSIFAIVLGAWKMAVALQPEVPISRPTEGLQSR